MHALEAEFVWNFGEVKKRYNFLKLSTAMVYGVVGAVRVYLRMYLRWVNKSIYLWVNNNIIVIGYSRIYGTLREVAYSWK